MKTARFKTNIKCMGCVATVTPFLNKTEGIKSWEVDLKNPDRILTATVADDNAIAALQQALENAGYSGEPIDIVKEL